MSSVMSEPNNTLELIAQPLRALGTLALLGGSSA